MTSENLAYRLVQRNGSRQIEPIKLSLTALQPHQIRIEMHAVSLNYRDLLVLREEGKDTAEGLIPLSDGAGVVVEVGSGVRRWKAGDRVSPAFFPRWVCGKFTKDYLPTALGAGHVNGVLARYVVACEAAVVEVPDYLSLAEAATLPCAGVTAWRAWVERGGLQAGQTVLIQGTGGVAIFALQMAVALGALPIVLSSSHQKLAQAKALGAWQTINYRDTPVWDVEVLRLTQGRGADHVLELGGPDTFQKSIASLAGDGKIAQIGVLTGFGPTPNLLALQFMNATIHGICVGSREHFEHLNRFLSEHRVKPVIDRTFSFDAVPEAYRYLATGQHFGKVVINLSGTKSAA